MGRLVHFVNSTTAIYMKRKQNRYNTFQFAQIVAKKAYYILLNFFFIGVQPRPRTFCGFF